MRGALVLPKMQKQVLGNLLPGIAAWRWKERTIHGAAPAGPARGSATGG